MLRRHRIRLPSRCISTIALHAVALLLLASCRNDQPPNASESQTREQPRAVFGTESKPAATDTRAREGPPPIPESEPARQSSPTPGVRKSESARVSRATPVQTRPSGVGDPGESMGRDRRVTVASTRQYREPAQERFLHYRPPGSLVGDAGELAGSQPRKPASTEGIRELIRRWADTLLSGNLDAHMRLYVPAVAESVRASKRTFVRTLAGTRIFEIYDLKLRTLSDGSVRAEFRVESDALRRSYRLDLRHIGGEWKIYREDSSGGVQGISTSRRTESK